MVKGDKNKVSSWKNSEEARGLENKIQSIHHVNNILDSDADFLTTEPQKNTSWYATLGDIKKSEAKITKIIRWFIIAISIATLGLLLDARRDHGNLEKMLELQNNLQKAINDNQQLKQEVEWLRKDFDSKLENEVNKAIIEVYKLKSTKDSSAPIFFLR